MPYSLVPVKYVLEKHGNEHFPESVFSDDSSQSGNATFETASFSL